ncbi:LCP family protein [Pedobacter psychrodurus]|uniref:LCP family protein n=1 Tax=Pedobacter psychrodurus TaxID=2530456 RepID=UPI00292DA7DF|nr:LCP family protein [Pedobacter psychrodurus]
MKIKSKCFLILLLIVCANSLYAQQILLIGSDSREENKRGNADLIMVITVKNKEVKLTSILRDTYVYIKGYGNQKINAAYRLGGRKLLISTINANFKTKLVSSIVT